MNFRSFTFTALLFSALACTAQTSHASTQILTLREAIDAALVHNRDLQIERINPEIARMTLQASWGYYDPSFFSRARRENISELNAFDPDNPGLETGYESENEVVGGGFRGFLPSGLAYTLSGNYGHSSGVRNGLNFDSYRMGAGIALQQPLLKDFWIDQPRYVIRVNRRNLQISEAGVHFRAMETINFVQQGYYDLIFAWENLRVQQSLLNARYDFLRGIQRQVEVGSMTVLEERVAASQHASVQILLISASNTLALAANNLRTLMGVTAADWTQAGYLPADRLTVAPEPLDLAASWQRGLARRPDLVQFVKEVEKAQLNVKFRRNQLYPSLDLIGAYGQRGASSLQAFPPDDPRASFTDAFDQFRNADAPSDMIGVVLSIPLTRKAERANLSASKEQQKQAELMVKQQEELIVREISDAIHTAQFSYDRVAAARRATEFAEAALKAEEERLQGGKSSIIFVLQLQADLAIAQTAEIRARQDYNRAVSQLHFAEGTILDQHQIVFEFK